MRAEHDEAIEAVRRSRARHAEPLPLRLGEGELAPFQWAGVRYLLEARRAFLADEPGLGKTVQALATLEADDAFPAVVVCPASLRLLWEREAARWLPHRTTTLLTGARPRAARGRHHDPELRGRRRASASTSCGAARAGSCSTSRTTARTRGRSAPRRSGGSRTASRATRCGSR